MSMQKKQANRKKRKQGASEAYHITRAVTHICLSEANVGKLAALDALAPVYLSLCQQYVPSFAPRKLPTN